MNKIDRISTIREFLKEENIDSFLITDSTVCEYITALHSSNISIYITTLTVHVLTDFRYMEIFKNACEDNGWEFVLLETGGVSAAIKNIAPKNSSVAIASDILTVDQFDNLEKNNPSLNFIKCSNKLSPLLAPKKDNEIQNISVAASIADSAFEEFLAKLKTGITEVEASLILEEFCRRGGSEKPSFDTIVLFGKRTSLPHGRPSSKKLEVGDYILVDFGCTVNGFCSDMTRTVVYGDASEKQMEIYNIVNSAREQAIEKIKIGVKASEVDAVARDYISSFGYGEYFGHGTGHGVGLLVHEYPALNSRSNYILKSDIVVTVEPGIYLPDFGGVRVEDMVLVTEHGATLITKSKREFRVIRERS